MRTLRRISQVFFLLLFVWLLLMTSYRGSDVVGYPVEWFHHVDPLLALTTALSSHDIAPGILWAVGLVVLTLLLGRFFCGWVCPMGTLSHVVGWMGKKTLRGKALADVSTSAMKLKYYVLIFLLISAMYSAQLTGIMDPIQLTTRSFSVAILPTIDRAVHAVLDFLLSLGGPVADLATHLNDGLQMAFYLEPKPVYGQGFFIGVLFLFILGVSFFYNRFWCRVLCPLGALLGILSRWSLVRLNLNTECSDCQACTFHCPGAADPHLKDRWRKQECYLAFNCTESCPNAGLEISVGAPQKPSKEADIGWERRKFLTATVAGVAAVPLLRTGFTPERMPPGLIRPPGARPEDEFLARCTACGQCMKVCPTNAIHPSLFEAGFEGLWTPTLVMTRGYCEFNCNLCGQVCPTGAIEELKIEAKREVRIGMAVIERGRCLPWANDKPCIVCEEHCPTPEKAIFTREVVVKARDGSLVTLQQPYVDVDLCIGCGICENKCPMIGAPAIRVVGRGQIPLPEKEEPKSEG